MRVSQCMRRRLHSATQRVPIPVSSVARRSFYTVKTELPPIVSCDWLSGQLEREKVKVVDASWYLPSAKRNPAAEFSTARIPGATFFDLDEIKDESSPYPRMMPSADEFEVHMSQLGLCHDDTIIVYDGIGIFSAPRAWFMLRSMGARNVAVLDGGFPLWRSLGKPIERGPMTGAFHTEQRAFSARASRISWADTQRVKRICSGVEMTSVLDARSRARFYGEIEETKTGLRSGHVPGAISMHYKQLLKESMSEDESTLIQTMRPLIELQRLFDEFGVDVTRDQVVSMCGSGVTACILSFGIHLVQWSKIVDDSDVFPPLCVYDGSWSEWGSRPDTRVETGIDVGIDSGWDTIMDADDTPSK